MRSVSIVQIEKGERANVRDPVVDEIPLAVLLDGRVVATLACSPRRLAELGVGCLRSMGLVRSRDEIKRIVVPPSGRAVRITLKKRPSLASAGKKSPCCPFTRARPGDKAGTHFAVFPRQVSRLMREFDRKSRIFQKTGGTHSAALSDGERILVFREDIGRRNALDKVIGRALLSGREMGRLAVLTSGRVSSEVISRVCRAGCPVLISRSAPTAQAVALARKWGMTLVGFARARRMNVYSGTLRKEEVSE